MDMPLQIPYTVYHKERNNFNIEILEFTKDYPDFKAERMYILSTADLENISGNHAHLNQSQILYLLKGKAELVLKTIDGKGSTFYLEDKAVFIPSKHWIELKLYPQTIVICLASRSYDTLESVYNFEEFLKLK